LGFYLISPLDVKIGMGNIAVSTNSNYKIKALWNTESIGWRLKCPGANYFYNNGNVYSETDKPIIFSKITELPKTITVPQLKNKALLPFKSKRIFFKPAR